MYHPLLSTFLFAFHCIVFVASITVNTVIVVLFLQRRKDIRGVLDRFSFSLTLGNLLCVCVTTPLILLQLASADAAVSLALIRSADVALTLLMCSSVINQLLIACNRLIGVAYALRYRNLMTTTRGRLLVASAWLLVAVTTVVVSVSANWPGKEEKWRLVINAVLFTVVFFIPLLLLTVVYGRIYVLARSNSQRRRRYLMTLMAIQRQSIAPLSKSISMIDTPSMARSSQHWQYASTDNKLVESKRVESSECLRYEFESISRRKELRTAKVSLAVVLLFVVSWLPLAVDQLLLVPAVKPLRLVSSAAAVSSTLVTPFLYVFISRCVRKRVIYMLRTVTSQSPHGESKTTGSIKTSIKPLKFVVNGAEKSPIKVLSQKYVTKDDLDVVKPQHKNVDTLSYDDICTRSESIDINSERNGENHGSNSWTAFYRSISESSCYTTTSDC